jgi:hypothetical protein
MRTSALRFTKQLALTLGLWACCLLSGAQTQEIEESFKRVSPQEQTRLQAILDEPLRTSAPQAELDRQVSQKLMAVRRLNIPKGEEAILQEAVKYTDNVFFRDNLTNLQSQQATPEKKTPTRTHGCGQHPRVFQAMASLLCRRSVCQSWQILRGAAGIERHSSANRGYVSQPSPTLGAARALSCQLKLCCHTVAA